MSEALLDQGLTALGLPLSRVARERLIAYAGLLIKWNRVYNLTAIRDPQQIVSHHLLDSLAVVPHLGSATSIADVGSGGGLPGIVLAIACPQLRICSIEAVGKKASFQQQVRIELGLENFSVVAQRVEAVKPALQFDAVISRAFSSLADFVALTRHLLRDGGTWLAMKGVYPADEIAALPHGLRVAAAITLDVPGLEAERNLIVLETN